MQKLLMPLMLAFVAMTANAEKTDLKLIGSQGSNYFFTVSEPWILDAKYVEGVGRNFCAGKPMCAAHFWKTGTAAATRLPMTDAQMAAELATFQRGRMMWRCGAYAIANSSNCFSD